MSAAQARAEQLRPPCVADRELMRLLGLLEDNRAGALTIAALRDRGIETPAVSVYELQLAGYEIDRVPCEHQDGRTALGYRLRARAGPGDRTIDSIAGDGQR